MEEQTLDLDFGNTNFTDPVQKWTLTGTSITARNIVGQNPEVKLNVTDIESSSMLNLEPFTINIVKYNIQQ